MLRVLLIALGLLALPRPVIALEGKICDEGEAAMVDTRTQTILRQELRIPSNSYVAAAHRVAEKLRAESNGKFQFRMVRTPEGEVRLDTWGDPRSEKKMTQALKEIVVPDTASESTQMVPISEVRFSQNTVGADRVKSKTKGENEPSPAYLLIHPKTKEKVVAILDGHHRAMSYVDPNDADPGTLIPVKLLSVDDVNRYINKNKSRAAPVWPKQMIELAIWEQLLPAGMKPKVTQDFDPTDRR